VFTYICSVESDRRSALRTHARTHTPTRYARIPGVAEKYASGKKKLAQKSARRRTMPGAMTHVLSLLPRESSPRTRTLGKIYYLSLSRVPYLRRYEYLVTSCTAASRSDPRNANVLEVRPTPWSLSFCAYRSAVLTPRAPFCSFLSLCLFLSLSLSPSLLRRTLPSKPPIFYPRPFRTRTHLITSVSKICIHNIGKKWCLRRRFKL